ncbi:MAG: glucokinase [Methylococcaceae bacterium]|nr:MAG: glucokinase [Methylococcaceae bacterium]
MSSGTGVLAGDVGGTKTLLALYAVRGHNLQLLREARYASADFDGLADMLVNFLAGEPVAAAGFGVAGPVAGGRCQATNLPWLLDEGELSAVLGGVPVKLLNDLEAVALGLLQVPDGAFVCLNAGRAMEGNIAVLAAGTGLGEAILHRHDGNYSAIACEGGHCDFAPADALQDGLLLFLRERCGGHVSYERILSGSGLHLVYQYLLTRNPELPDVLQGLDGSGEDPAALIAQRGLEQDDAACRLALRLFARIYGQEAGNLALKCLARGGVLLAGGIAPKLLPVLSDGSFMAGFCDKGRFADLLRDMPVRVCLEPQAPLLGAATAAARLA